jgi:hypothetical protein
MYVVAVWRVPPKFFSTHGSHSPKDTMHPSQFDYESLRAAVRGANAKQRAEIVSKVGLSHRALDLRIGPSLAGWVRRELCRILDVS